MGSRVAEHKAPTLKRNFSWSFVGNGFYAATQWGMITVLAKLGTQEMVGQFALGLAIVTPVMLFTNMQLSAVQVTDAKREYRFGNYLALRFLTTAIAMVAITAIALATESRQTILVVLLIALAKAFESVSEVFYGLFMQHESMDRMAQSMIIKGTLALIGLGLGVYLTGSLVWGVVGMGLGWFLVLFTYDIRSGASILRRFPERDAEAQEGVRLSSKLRPRWEVGKLTKLGRLALPMSFVMALVSLNTNIPRYFVEHYLGKGDLGVFAAMSYAVISGYMVIRALGYSASPRMARYYSDGDERGFIGILLKTMAVSAAVGVAGVLAVAVAGREILTILYTAEYADDTGVFLVMMIVAGLSFVVSSLSFGITNARYFGSQIPLLAASSSSIALACWWLVPAYGLMGGAVALIIGNMVQLLGSLAIVVHAVHSLREKTGG